jgi:hypothetical protein
MLKWLIVFSCFIFFITWNVSCTKHKVEVAPVEIKPIHITIDVNVKIDKALDDFFGDIDKTSKSLDQKASSGNKR